MARPSIRWRLTLWYGCILALLLSAFSATVYWTMRHHLMQRIDRGLAEELADVRYEVERACAADGLSVWLERRFARHEGFDFQITRDDGTRFFVSERLLDTSFPPTGGSGAEPHFETVSLGQPGRWRVVSVRVRGPDRPLTVQVARSLAAFEHESEELLWAFLLAGPLTVALTLAGGYFLACRTLAPVQQMTRTADRITADRLGERIPVANPADELGALATTLNRMIDRLEQSFDEMRRFTADAAHELRTPLAVMRNEAEVALRTPRDSDEYRRVVENLLDETVRLSGVADQLLFLSRQDAGLLPPASEVVDAARLVRDVAENMRLVAEEKGVTLAVGDLPPCTLSSDGRLLRRVLYNLLDNAIKYTPRPGRVSVDVDVASGWWTVSVRDTGVGIPPEHLGRVFERFYRADPSRSDDFPGVGLGLAICRSIARVLGGSVALESTVGAGTSARFTVPTGTA